jgi:putative membrane protein
MWPYIMGGFGWAGWFMPVLMVVFWGLIIWGIVVLVRYIVSHSSKHSETALEELKLRYARGEVTRAEFEEKKDLA